MDKLINNENLRFKSKNATSEKVEWIPSYGKERMFTMLENRPDWCISRQRLWCTPMALFIHKTTEELHPKWQELMSITATQVEQEGIIFWHNLNTEPFLKQYASEYPATDYIKITDTLDVWFDAGVSHNCILNPDEFPADLYLEGSDQFRGWFQSSLLTSLAIKNQAPYKQVVTHGFTVDENGHKMSKSLGNVIDPHKIINTNGADILRLWVASVYYPDDMALSEEILNGVIDIYRRIRNTARYLLSNLHDFDPNKNLIPIENMLQLDIWAVNQAVQLQNNIQIHYDKYEFYAIYDQLRIFTSTWMGNFYLDIIKDRLYTTKENSLARRSAQTALYHILEILVRAFAPIISFTAEEIWQCMRTQFADKREESVFLSVWYKFNHDFSENFINFITNEDWLEIYQVRIAVYKELEKLRALGHIGSGLNAEVELYCGEHLLRVLNRLDPRLRGDDNKERGDDKSNYQSELHYILITSCAKILPESIKPNDANKAENLDHLWIKVIPSKHPKCARCWHHSADVGSNNEHPTLCGRCINNLFGEGETRDFA